MSNRPARSPRRAPRLLPVGRFFGVPLYFAPSWVLIATVITATYNSIIYDAVVGIGRGASYVVALVFAVAFALCVLAHELGHVAVSLRLGRPVRRVVIFLLGGVSEMEGDIDRARDEFLVAIAGPLVSLGLGGLAWAAQTAFAPNTVGSVLLLLLMWSNLVVAVFNMLPGLPLDGGRVLRAGLWRLSHSRLGATRAAAWVGRGIAVVVAVPSVLLHSGDWSIATALFGVALAAFIWLGATQSLRIAEVQQRLPGVRLRHLMRPGLLVHADVSVAEALRRTWDANARGLVVVDAADRPRAIVDEQRIGAVPAERRAWTSVADVARPLEPGMILPVDLDGDALMDAIRSTPAAEYLVVNGDGSPAGVLAATDLADALTGQRA